MKQQPKKVDELVIDKQWRDEEVRICNGKCMLVSVRSICRVGSDTDPTTFQRKKCHQRRMEILKRFALKQKREADAKNQKPSPQCMAEVGEVAILKRYVHLRLHLTYSLTYTYT